METATRDLVRRRAEDRCEYCRLPQAAAPFISFCVDHIIAQQHLLNDDPENLAWSCRRCNGYKGPNLSSIDPGSGDVVPLFHPRRNVWNEHFRVDGAEIVGLTPTGRATVRLLGFNDDYRVELRSEWLRDHPLDRG
jgi:hypothetical protein